MLLINWLTTIAERYHETRRIGHSRRRRSAVGHQVVAVQSVETLEDRTLLSTFVVNVLTDTVDVNPGDGLAQDATGNTSLRAAIMESNALAGADTINLGAGTFTLSIAGAGEDAAATGDLDITGDLTIIGAGSSSTVIDAADLDRVFHVLADVAVNISRVNITGGSVPLDNGGGVSNVGTLTLAESVVSANRAAIGGGLFNFGKLSVLHSAVSR